MVRTSCWPCNMVSGDAGCRRSFLGTVGSQRQLLSVMIGLHCNSG